MSMSGSIMTNTALDAALDNLGMLSTSIVNRPQVVDDQIPRLAALSIDDILQNPEMGSRAVSCAGKEKFIIQNGYAASANQIEYKPHRKRVHSTSSAFGRCRRREQKILEEDIKRMPTGECRRMHPYGVVQSYGNMQRRWRTRSENESEILDHIPHCSSVPHSHMDPVPFIAFPLDGELSSNLFKSRSMESIDARTSDENVVTSEKDPIPIINASFAEVDAVSGGLHRLNVSE